MRKASGSIVELNQSEIEFEGTAPLAVQVKPEKAVLLNLPSVPSISGITLGILAGFEERGAPLVTVAENPGPLVARATVGLSKGQIGCEVALVFERGDITKPIILGCVRTQTLAQREATLDGEQVVLSAEREITLRCGKSSITLTRDGKVIIRGAYLLSRSSGVNRIKGGSVQIN